MSVRLKFLLFVSSAVAAGLLVSSVWNLRARLAILFALLAGAVLGKLFADWEEELKEAAAAAPDRGEERKRGAERAGIRAGALLEVMMRGMREGVLVVDSETRVVASNLAAREVFGPAGGAPKGHRLLGDGRHFVEAQFEHARVGTDRRRLLDRVRVIYHPKKARVVPSRLVVSERGGVVFVEADGERGERAGG
jgi:PAS domain-containing protein